MDIRAKRLVKRSPGFGQSTKQKTKILREQIRKSVSKEHYIEYS
jgi:hypothetical protein